MMSAQAAGTRADALEERNASVTITSKWSPEGRSYRLRPLREMSPAELTRLAELGGARILRVRPFVGLKVSRLVDEVLLLVLPDLEPRILRRLSLDARVSILKTWERVNS